MTELPSSGPHGMTSIEPGNIMDRGPEEYYASAPFKLPEGASVSKVSWEAEIPPKTWVKAQLRSAATEGALEKATWRGPGEDNAWFDNGQEAQPDAFAGRWVQYRLALGAVAGGSTPRVTAVSVHYDRG